MREHVSAFFGELPIASPVTLSLGSLYGIRCPDPERCDCTALGRFEPFDVLQGEAIYVMNRQLAPGRYCLPSGVSHCNHNTSYQLFTASGWKCVPRMTHATLCHSEHAKDNTQNVLWDYANHQKAADPLHVYEKLSDGGWRYRCKCGSKDQWNRRMVSSTPWTCSVDYCVREIWNVTPGMGFDGSQCNCGTAVHEDPDDKTSPCQLENSQVVDSKFIGRVECTNEASVTKHGLFCPSGERVLRSKETVVAFHAYVEEFLEEYKRVLKLI